MESKCASGFRVVENENRREKCISFYPKEVEQICKDISRFFNPSLHLQPHSSPRHSSPETKHSIHIPEALALLLQNPSIWFYEYKILEQLVTLDDGLIAFAQNVDNAYLCCGEDIHDGGIFEQEQDGESEKVGENLATYLEAYRDALLSNKLEFIQDVGVVEKAPTHK